MVERYSIYTCITVVEIQNYIPGLGPGPHGSLVRSNPGLAVVRACIVMVTRPGFAPIFFQRTWPRGLGSNSHTQLILYSLSPSCQYFPEDVTV